MPLLKMRYRKYVFYIIIIIHVGLENAASLQVLTLMRQMTVAGGSGRQTLSSQAAGGHLQGRYSSSRSLELLRLNIQNLINKDIDSLLRKYLDKFFKPAIVNIRRNLGAGSVNEEDIRAVCVRILEDAKIQYTLQYPPYNETVSNGRQRAQCSSNVGWKRKDAESDTDPGKVRKKALRTVTSILPGTPTPIRLVKLEGVRREGPKWDPARITRSTLFIMGARANKVLGFGQTRGRLYTKHPELLKYSGDTEDKEWLSRNNLMPPTGGIAYLLLLEDIRELAQSADYRHNPNVLLHELKGFYAPDFMLEKIRRFVAQARTEGRDDFNLQFYDGNQGPMADAPSSLPVTGHPASGMVYDNSDIVKDPYMYTMGATMQPLYTGSTDMLQRNAFLPGVSSVNNLQLENQEHCLA